MHIVGGVETVITHAPPDLSTLWWMVKAAVVFVLCIVAAEMN
jgi:hypothetical protein